MMRWPRKMGLMSNKGCTVLYSAESINETESFDEMKNCASVLEDIANASIQLC
jgi:hypothetical protein